MKIGFWNVAGIKKKLEEEDFRLYLMKFDIFGVAETWVGENENIQLAGFTVITKGKFKKGKRGRQAGGLAIFINNSSKIKFELIEGKVEEIMWVRIRKK